MYDFLELHFSTENLKNVDLLLRAGSSKKYDSKTSFKDLVFAFLKTLK